ncbi:MAG: extradiol dioxygenase family protein [Saprospiraceae bacterium]|jgi:extradiol dioxygenase family protein
MRNLMSFHLVIPVSDLNETRTFYREIIGYEEGRSDSHWVDLDFHGHQLVLHMDKNRTKPSVDTSNEVDGHAVPTTHFGVVLKWDDWHQLVDSLKAIDIKFGIEPYIRFEGQPGEQATIFFYDPSENALEFKSFRDIGNLFAS